MPEAGAQINQAKYGIFFDGTGSNDLVDTKFDDDTQELTNMANLFELDSPAKEQNTGKQSINGIGSRDIDLMKSGEDTTYSSIEMTFGIGAQEGIDGAIPGIQQFLEAFRGVKTLLLDVF